MNRSSITLPACALALFLAAAIHAATAPEQPALTAANCALAVPPGWHPMDLSKQPGMVAAFGDADGNRTLMVLTYQRGQQGQAVSDAYATGFDGGMEKSGGGQKTSGKFVRVAGFEAYERHGTMNANGRDLTTLALAIPTGDGTYLLEALAAKGEAADDPEIAQAVGSFHFLRPPGPPKRPTDAATRVGYLVGQSLGSLTLLGLIAWAISKAFSKRTPPAPAGLSGPYPYPQAGFPPSANLPPPPPAVPSTPPPLPPTSC